MTENRRIFLNIVITYGLDQVFVPGHDGVRTISVYDFLLGDDF